MHIELKNVKYAAFASEETSCFEATVYVDGKKAGTARNEGRGGMTWVEPTALREQLDAYGATLPPKSADMGEGRETFTYPQNAETLVDDLLHDWLTERDFKRVMKRVTVRVPTDPVGSFRTYAATVKPTPENLAKIAAGNPGVVVLNQLPYADALELYRAGGAA